MLTVKTQLHYKIMVIFALALSIAGCQPDFLKKTEAPGTGDSGGGNTFNGKPIDSYIRDPKKLIAFQKYIGPIQKSLTDVYNGRILSYFKYALVNKPWYFVPGELTQLPPSQIGSEVPTEQAALQNFDRIWVNSLIFDKMTENDQANLILHEILMMIKILKFESDRTQCLAANLEYPSFCFTLRDARRGNINLIPKDYDDIRSTVFEIFENDQYQKLKQEEWDDLFWRKNFSTTNQKFYPKDRYRSESINEVLSWFKRADLTGNGPRYAYSFKSFAEQYPQYNQQNLPPYGTLLKWSPFETCSFNIQEKSTGILKFTYQLGKDTFSYERNLKDANTMTLTMNIDWNGQIVRYGNFFSNMDEPHKIGDKIYETYFTVSGMQIQSVQLTRLVCTDEACNTWSSTSDGPNFYCRIDSEINYRIE